MTDETEPEGNQLNPTLGLRSWNDLSSEEKDNIWFHLIDSELFISVEKQLFYIYMCLAMAFLSSKYTNKPYGKDFSSQQTQNNRKLYIKKIFKEESQDVVLELLSFLINCLELGRGIMTSENCIKILINQRNDEEFLQFINFTLDGNMYEKFTRYLNHLFKQNLINLEFNNDQDEFIPRQDPIITEEIKPVLEFLSNNKKFEPVNRDLRDAFAQLHQHTGQGYSTTITKAIAALEGFLQITVDSKKCIQDLVKKGIKKGPIKGEEETLMNLIKIIMKMRDKYSDAHSKKEYANEKHALLVLNIVMILMQYYI